jgi:hypothetical protein
MSRLSGSWTATPRHSHDRYDRSQSFGRANKNVTLSMRFPIISGVRLCCAERLIRSFINSLGKSLSSSAYSGVIHCKYADIASEYEPGAAAAWHLVMRSQLNVSGDTSTMNKRDRRDCPRGKSSPVDKIRPRGALAEPRVGEAISPHFPVPARSCQRPGCIGGFPCLRVGSPKRRVHRRSNCAHYPNSLATTRRQALHLSNSD